MTIFEIFKTYPIFKLKDEEGSKSINTPMRFSIYSIIGHASNPLSPCFVNIRDSKLKTSWLAGQ